MRFRFTISRDIPTPEPFPAIESWLSDPLGAPIATLPWQDVGTANPNVPNFSGATSGSPKSSHYLYTDYVFQAGWTYRIEITIEQLNLTMFPSNPRSLVMNVFDSLNNVIFAKTSATTVGVATYFIEFTATSECTRFGFRYVSGSNRSVEVQSIDDIITPVTDHIRRINEPDGWDGAQLKLKRDPEYKSLTEFFEGTFIFYGDNGEVDGGFNTIRRWEEEMGPDATIHVQIDFSEEDDPDLDDDSQWILLFMGQFDLSLLDEMLDNMMRVPIIRDDFWAKFMSRKDTPVNLMSTEDLDGASVTPFANIITRLDSQKIRKQYQGYIDSGIQILDADGWDVGDFLSFDTETSTIQEIDIAHLGTTVVPGKSIILVAPDDGQYALDIRIENWARNIATTTTLPAQPYVLWYIQVNNDAPIAFTATDYGSAPYESTVYTFLDSLNLKKGDVVYQFGEIVGDIGGLGGTPTFFFVGFATNNSPSGAGNDTDTHPSYINITAETTFPSTTTEGFFLHDAPAAALIRYGLGTNYPFYSKVFGSSKTIARKYFADGCHWNYSVQKGLQVKTYSLTEKPNFMSFSDWWRGVKPIFNVGLTYEYIDPEVIDEGGEVVEWCPEEQPDLADFIVLDSSLNPDLNWGLNPGDPITLLDVDIPVGGIPINAVSDIIEFPTNVDFEVGRTHTYQLDVSSTFSFSTEDIEIEVVQLSSGGSVLDTHTSAGTTAAPISDTFDITIVSGCVRLGIRVRFPTGTSNNGLISVDTFEDVTECSDDPPSEPIEYEGTWAIRVEPIEEFYDPEFIVSLSNIADIGRTYDTNYLFKKITIGYTEWQSEDIRGIDDPQTVHVYATPFKKVGEEDEMRSTFVAASLAIEATRRKSLTKSEDYKFDNKDMIIALNVIDASPGDVYIPEMDERFSSVTNLLNNETRYNLAITAGRNFLRFRNWYNGGLESYLGNVYRFTGGEGNYDLASEMVVMSPDCSQADFDGQLFTEKQNIEITADKIHSAHYYTIKDHPLSLTDYLIIRNNRKKAIGISQTDGGHVALFIDELTYFPAKGTCNVTGWTRAYLQLQVIESLTPQADCLHTTVIPCDGDALTDEFGEYITDENGECITSGEPSADTCLGDGLEDEFGELITDELGECIYV